ncbi:MAG: beta-Ala-His dipeptidase [Candidatus Lokiarchaeota archaeon]|nr:beta-Ala-His dipeptidase [Candidatus Lokiarchaeota archaeon]
MRDLGNPPEFWEYFEQISKIPRCSGYEGQIRNYVKNEAEKFHFETKIDKVGNLLVRIPPKNNKKSNIILQSHLDMVCEKNENTAHDFSKDPLKLRINEINGKKWVTADGTTLGADNGTGIATQLALMKKIHSGKLEFGQLGLDLLFTIDEEVGMSGVYQIDEDMIEGNQLINLDGIQDKVITIGSVGMIASSFELKLERTNINQEDDKFEVIKIVTSGLLGGHSGCDINRGRANAIILIVRILWKLNDKYSIFINSINGGKASNAIPREADTILYVNKKDITEINDYINILSTEIKNEFKSIDDGIQISIQKLENFENNKVISKQFQDKILDVLYIMPNGPISMHPDIENLVFTSSNLASITTKKNRIEITTSQRSFEECSYKVVYEKISALFLLAGLNFKFKNRGSVGSWNPDFSSKLLKLSKETYKDLFKEEIKVQVIHATLETGLLKLKFPKIDIVSFSPKIDGAHSPYEQLNVMSVENYWEFLLGILKNLSY